MLGSENQRGLTLQEQQGYSRLILCYWRVYTESHSCQDPGQGSSLKSTWAMEEIWLILGCVLEGKGSRGNFSVNRSISTYHFLSSFSLAGLTLGTKVLALSIYFTTTAHPVPAIPLQTCPPRQVPPPKWLLPHHTWWATSSGIYTSLKPLLPREGEASPNHQCPCTSHSLWASQANPNHQRAYSTCSPAQEMVCAAHTGNTLEWLCWTSSDCTSGPQRIPSTQGYHLQDQKMWMNYKIHRNKQRDRQNETEKYVQKKDLRKKN